MKKIPIIFMLLSIVSFISCKNEAKTQDKIEKTAQDILGNPDYLAMSYGGYRYADHGIEPSIDQLKDDMKLLAAMDIKMLRIDKLQRI